MDKEHGRHLGIAELAEIMEVPRSTAHFWFASYDHPHVRGFMALLEQLTQSEREAFVDSHCRVLPSLIDPSLNEAANRLKELLAQEVGITFLIGSSSYARAFLLAACGHWLIRRAGSLPSGLDLHPSEALVPVRGLHYADKPLDPRGAKELTLRLWPKIVTSNAQLLLFNGVWSLVPELADVFLRLAATKQLIFAEQSPPAAANLRPTSRLNVVTVSEGPRPETPWQIQITSGGTHASR
jgi:hypothetical protein